LSRARRRLVGAACAVATGALGYGCSLGLDASKIATGTADSGIPTPPGDGAAADGSGLAVDSGAHDGGVEAGRCSVNSDCTSSNECLVGACDAGTCSFSVCPTQACQGSSCLGTLVCSPPVSYGFHATQISVNGAVGCGGNAQACIAAAYPFVFVGTTSQVVAYAVSDPSNPSPTPVPISGLPFVPTFMTAMGSRVFFFGAPQGTGSSYPIASIDVPSSPLAPSLQATAVLDVTSSSPIGAVLARTDGALFLVETDTASFPAGIVTPPLTSGPVTLYQSPGVPSGATPVAASGARLLFAHYQAGPPSQALFSFENAAGTQGASSSAEDPDGGEQPSFTGIGPTTPHWVFAQGGDGSDLWNAETAVTEDGGVAVGAVRLAWLVASGTAAQVTPATYVNVEAYAPPTTIGSVAGPVAWVDSTTALVLATAHEYVDASPTQTSVQVAVSTPSPALASGRRTLIAQPVGQLGAAASGGFGYVLAPGSSATTSTLHVFAPGCTGP
jgi:hypothetical protein